MEATSFYFQGKRVYVDDDVPKSTIYTLDTNDIRIKPMKNDWSEIHSQFESLDADVARVEALVWRLFFVVLGMVMTALVVIGLNMVSR